MKKIAFSSLCSIVALFLSAVAVQAFTYQPTITSIDQVDTQQPVPHDVHWTVSEQVTNGDKVIDHFRITVTVVADDSEVCTDDAITADALTYQLSSSTCAELDVYIEYNVELVEVYTDATESNADNMTFYTNPPKPKSLKIKHRLANSIRLKFSRGVQIAGEYMYIDYKVARAKNAGKIVANGEIYTGTNYIDVDGLPAGKALQIRMRFRSSGKGNSPWSSWTKFKTKAD